MTNTEYRVLVEQDRSSDIGYMYIIRKSVPSDGRRYVLCICSESTFHQFYQLLMHVQVQICQSEAFICLTLVFGVLAVSWSLTVHQFFCILHSYLSHPGIWSSLHEVVNIDPQAALFLCFSRKQNIESTEECSNSIARKITNKLGKRIGLNKSQMGRDQVSGGVSVLCRHGTPIVNVLWKPLRIQQKVEFGKTNKRSRVCIKSNRGGGG